MGYIMELRRQVGSRPLIMAGSCVLVFNEEGHLLLQKRSDSCDWGTIGGALELGESLESAASRELYEETGLRAERFELKTVFSGEDMYCRYPNGDEVYNVMAVFEAQGVSGTAVVNDDEGLELRYWPLIAPIPELNPMTARVLRRLGYDGF